MSEQNKRVVMSFIEAMGKSDPDTAAKCLAPDATTLAKGFGKFAGIRHYDRIIGTIAVFKQLVPSGLSPIVHTITAEENRVVVEFEGDATLANGAAYCNQYCMVFTLLDGRIKHVNEYFCTKLADEVLYPVVETFEQQQGSTK
jgi:ketosteroid isomerase-like protein